MLFIIYIDPAPQIRLWFRGFFIKPNTEFAQSIISNLNAGKKKHPICGAGLTNRFSLPIII